MPLYYLEGKIMNIKYLFLSLILVFSSALSAKTYDESDIKNLVKQEVERMLNSNEFMDGVIERGLNNYVRRQKLAEKVAKERQQKERAKNLRPVDLKRDHVRGDVNAPVTIIEYSDFECPFCKRFHPNVQKLLDNNPKKLRWVYRHFPLGFHDPGATKQAEATECAAELGGNDAFWKYSDLIYKRTRSNGKGFPLANLKPLAVEIGLNGDAFEACYNSGKYANRVNEDKANGAKVGVTGTPAAFIINKKGTMRFVAGALPFGRLQALLDEVSAQ